MLKSIKQLFTRESPKQLASPQEPDVGFNSNPRFLRKSTQITHLLGQLKEEGSLFTIFIDGVEESFASTILAIRPEERCLLFDELNSKTGHELLLKTGKFKAQASHNGVDAIFTIDSLEKGDSKGIAYYKVPLPDEIYYPQRRGSRRIRLQSSQSIPFHATITTGNTPLLGHLQNISSTGIGALISSRLPCRRGDLLQNCRIPLPDGSTINFDLTIRALNSNQMSQKVYLGGFFKNIDSSSRKKLERFIIKAEREQIKQNKSD
jgi:c-di-GMP-binding flagellar brake protein YcgR